jgi:hypothetical protein
MRHPLALTADGAKQGKMPAFVFVKHAHLSLDVFDTDRSAAAPGNAAASAMLFGMTFGASEYGRPAPEAPSDSSGNGKVFYQT